MKANRGRSSFALLLAGTVVASSRGRQPQMEERNISAAFRLPAMVVAALLVLVVKMTGGATFDAKTASFAVTPSQAGPGYYRASSTHPPFVHVDLRGTSARWRT
jgi:hypothetical protein